MLGLAQDRTEAHLRNALIEYGGRVHYDVELLELEQDEGGVKVKLGNPPGRLDEVHFDYLIGADGVHGVVRPQLGIEAPGFELASEWSIADVDAEDWMHSDAFTVCQVENGNVVVIAPLEDTRYRVISSTPDALAALPLEMRVTNIRRAGAFSISVRMAETYQSGRVFLAGDAAHSHSPAGGRGMNLGIADAVDLARRMVDGDLVGYSEHRHAVGKHVIGKSEQARKIMTATNPFIRFGTVMVLWVVSRSSWLQRRVAIQALFD